MVCVAVCVCSGSVGRCRENTFTVKKKIQVMQTVYSESEGRPVSQKHAVQPSSQKLFCKFTLHLDVRN